MHGGRCCYFSSRILAITLAVLLSASICFPPGKALASCTAPPGEGGDIVYNADHHVMQYCNGDDWIGFPKGPAGCDLPWGGTIASGDSVTAYETPSVPYGDSCADEQRECDAGDLSGSFEHPACTMENAADCTLDGQMVAHGDSFTFYSAEEDANCASIGANRTCDNGTLSGDPSFQYASCAAPVSPTGQQLFTTTGSFVVPANVYSISAVCIGKGMAGGGRGGGSGGDLRYAVALPVTPGETLTIVVYTGTSSGYSSIARGATILVRAKAGFSGTSTPLSANIGGGDGGAGGSGTSEDDSFGNGGGAGTYTGNGPGGGVVYYNPGNPDAITIAGFGSYPNSTSYGPNGAGYGWGGGSHLGGTGNGAGVVRIIWGPGRAYPSTNTGDM